MRRVCRLLDGELVNSCLVPVLQVDAEYPYRGRLEKDGHLHRFRKLSPKRVEHNAAFVRRNDPGFLSTARAIIRIPLTNNPRGIWRQPVPLHGLSENIRCSEASKQRTQATNESLRAGYTLEAPGTVDRFFVS